MLSSVGKKPTRAHNVVYGVEIHWKWKNTSFEIQLSVSMRTRNDRKFARLAERCLLLCAILVRTIAGLQVTSRQPCW